jgi:4-nitrophenyl phosphatase
VIADPAEGPPEPAQDTHDGGAVRERLRAARGVVFDMDGTLVLGDRRNHGLSPLPGALALTRWLTSRGTPWVTFTNGTTRTPEHYARALRAVGFDLADGAVLTPATSAVELLRGRGHRRVLVLGTPALAEPLRRAGLDAVGPQETAGPNGVAGVDAVVVGWYREFTMDQLEAACDAVFAGAALYSASQSVFFASAQGRVLGTSRAICGMITAVTGRAEEVVGKPSLAALHCAANRLGAESADLVVVGDDPELEMAMAHRGGALAVGVTTGVHTASTFAEQPAGRRPHLVLDGVDDLLPLFRRARPVA